VQFDELRFLCEQAAVELAGAERPVLPTVVLPGAPRTRLLRLTDLPDDDASRTLLLAGLADTELSAGGVPCWGFVAEGEVDGADVVVVAFGARRHAPHVMAAPRTEDDGVGGFTRPEELDRAALTFLHPLQRAVDGLAGVEDVFATFDPKRQPWGGDPD
jgi:hypothetical protein